jgi:hypothetical protein
LDENELEWENLGPVLLVENLCDERPVEEEDNEDVLCEHGVLMNSILLTGRVLHVDEVYL